MKLTKSKDALPATPRKACRESLLVWCFIIAEADLRARSQDRKSSERTNEKTNIPIYAVDDIFGRQWWDLGVDFREHVSEFLNKFLELLFCATIHRLCFSIKTMFHSNALALHTM